MSDSLIISMYEEGRTVKEIANAIDKRVSEVNTMLAKTDEAQTVQVARHQKHVRTIRRVRALADEMTMAYMETLRAVIDNPDSTVKEKSNAFAEMDKVLRIAKLYSDRVLLAEGKTTENIGVNGQVGMPFNVVFTKTYESPAEPEIS